MDLLTSRIRYDIYTMYLYYVNNTKFNNEKN